MILRLALALLLLAGAARGEERVVAALSQTEVAITTNFEGSEILIFGAAHIAVELVRLARMFDFEAIVIDPRKTFAERTQFTDAPDQMLIDWPAEVLPQFTLDHFTYAVLLTHDPKIDDQALDILLNSEIGYIGAIGSKRTNAKREARLRTAGYDDAAIARSHAPIGLNIGAKGAKEIALSIMAEIVKVKNGKD